MKYVEALQYIHSPKYNKMELGLDQIRMLMATLGNPQEKLRCIHIAGTNGKGSVASYLSHILMEAGYKTGLFTSPFIERFNERIKVNGEDISDDDLAKITEKIKGKIEENEIPTTEFEIMTAIAFEYFYEQNCDIVVLEVGLGGRLDSTNVIEEPLLSVITSISQDHQAFLGTTLSEIAREKAGIIKENRPLLLYSQEKETEDAIFEIAKLKKSSVHQPDFSKIRTSQSDLSGQVFDYKDYDRLKIKLLGAHQLKNATMAIEAVHLLKDIELEITEEAVRSGLEKTVWPGRFEILKKDPVFIIDGAHNIDSVQALLDNLTKYFPKKKVIGIVGMLKDKDIDSIINMITPIISQFITVTPISPRAIQASDLARQIQEKNAQAKASQSYKEAIAMAMEEAEEGDIICSFGSLYYIGEIRKIIGNEYRNEDI